MSLTAGLTAGLAATGDTTLCLDTTRIESALARKIANDEQRAAAEAIRLEQLTGHKNLLLSIVSNQSLLKLLVVTGR